MLKTANKISFLVESQLPDFINENETQLKNTGNRRKCKAIKINEKQCMSMTINENQ